MPIRSLQYQISVSKIFCSGKSPYISRGMAQFQICQFLCAAFNCFELVILIVCPSYGIVYLHLFALFSHFQCLSSINTISVPWLNFTTITFSRQQTFIPKYLDNTLIDFAQTSPTSRWLLDRGKSSRERFWKKSYQCREIRLPTSFP